MLVVVKRLFLVYLIFLSLLLGYVFYSKGIDLSAVTTLINVTGVFVLVVLTMWFMGRPPRGKNCIDAFQNATIDKGVQLNRRKLRRWISCSYGVEKESFNIYTFGKIKETCKKNTILRFYSEGKDIVVEFSDRKWYLTTTNVKKSIETLEQFSRKRNEN